MSAHDFETHRCIGSLDACCSIRRYPKRTPAYYPYDDGQWHLSQRFNDLEYDCTYLEYVTRIRFCPWCGKEL